MRALVSLRSVLQEGECTGGSGCSAPACSWHLWESAKSGQMSGHTPKEMSSPLAAGWWPQWPCCGHRAGGEELQFCPCWSRGRWSPRKIPGLQPAAPRTDPGLCGSFCRMSACCAHREGQFSPQRGWWLWYQAGQRFSSKTDSRLLPCNSGFPASSRSTLHQLRAAGASLPKGTAP